MATPDRATECDWVRAELAEDLRDPEAAGRIDAHMARCPSCRADRDWGLRLASCLSDVPPTPSAIDVAGRVRSLVDRRRWLRRSLATGALASVACLLLGLGVGRLAPWRNHHPSGEAAVAVQSSSRSEEKEWSEWTVLVLEPPITPVCRSQSTWIAVLTEVAEGETP
jgi:hypothetical protein